MAVVNFNTANMTYRQLIGNGLSYAVPHFQRDYSWSEEEWEDLWADMKEVLYSEQDTSHYLGYLVLQSQDNRRFSIIDGQQRLTTLSIFVLAVLKNLESLVAKGIDKNNNRLRIDQLRSTFIGYLDPVSLISRSKLSLNRNNDSYYQNYLVPLEKLPIRGLRASEHNMRKAFDWFDRHVGDEFGIRKDGAVLADILDRLSDRLFFTVISVTDELNAYKVFETLNARGVRLSSTDLLKNYLFSVVHRATGDSLEIDILERKWESLAGKLGAESFPEFLRTFWNSRNKFVRHAELFKAVRNEIADRAAVFELMRAMDEDADVYMALSKPEDELWNDPFQRRCIEELKLFGVRQCYPLLMAAYRTRPLAEFTSLLKACVVISFRYNVIGNLQSNDQERVYTIAAQKVHSGQLNTLQEILHELRSIYLDDSIFERAFADKELRTVKTRTKNTARYILFQIEKYVSGKNFDQDTAHYTIEHILPENPGEGWEHFSDKDHEQFVFRIGNLALLKNTDNRVIGNARFEEKQQAFAKSEFDTTKELAQSPEPWSPERIAARQRRMAKKAKTIWRIDQLS